MRSQLEGKLEAAREGEAVTDWVPEELWPLPRTIAGAP